MSHSRPLSTFGALAEATNSFLAKAGLASPGPLFQKKKKIFFTFCLKFLHRIRWKG